MLSSSFDELQNALSTHRDLLYATVGALVVSFTLHYASRVNRINEGEPPLLPGALPLFGHALSFVRDNNKVYETARCVLFSLILVRRDCRSTIHVVPNFARVQNYIDLTIRQRLEHKLSPCFFIYRWETIICKPIHAS